MKNKKIMKRIFFYVFLLVIAFVLAVATYMLFGKIQKNKYKKILQENDATNYELTEIEDGIENKVYVRDKILLAENGNTKIWVNELEQKRVTYDEHYKTVILDQNDETLKVNSLNYTYINDFFDNSSQKFKYLGSENGYHKLQFKDKNTNIITVLYLNEKTNVIDKMVQIFGNSEHIIEFKVRKNSVSEKEVEFPNLEGYRVYDSVNSRPE